MSKARESDIDTEAAELSRGGGGALGLAWELRYHGSSSDGSSLYWYPHGGYKWLFRRVGEGQVVFDSVEQMCETAPSGQYQDVTQDTLPRSVEYAVDQSKFSLRECVVRIEDAMGGQNE